MVCVNSAHTIVPFSLSCSKILFEYLVITEQFSIFGLKVRFNSARWQRLGLDITNHKNALKGQLIFNLSINIVHYNQFRIPLKIIKILL